MLANRWTCRSSTYIYICRLYNITECLSQDAGLSRSESSIALSNVVNTIEILEGLLLNAVPVIFPIFDAVLVRQHFCT
eukprot:scaffold485309_cov23-Prasinocladus_malaysianus.AAC.1